MIVKPELVLLVICMVLCNIGTPYIIMDLNQKYKSILNHPYMRYLYMFSIAYIGSHDIALSAIMSILYGIL